MQIRACQSAAYLLPVTLLTGTARQKVVAAKMPRIDVVAQCELSAVSTMSHTKALAETLRTVRRCRAGRGQWAAMLLAPERCAASAHLTCHVAAGRRCKIYVGVPKKVATFQCSECGQVNVAGALRS